MASTFKKLVPHTEGVKAGIRDSILNSIDTSEQSTLVEHIMSPTLIANLERADSKFTAYKRLRRKKRALPAIEEVVMNSNCLNYICCIINLFSTTDV